MDGEYGESRVQQMMDHFGDSLSNWIVVGIVNLSTGQAGTNRRRDLLYANGAAQFLDFITDELIPVVEKDYQIKKRILYGHSFGGSFAVFAMLRKPGYFDGYIASSPTPIMDLIQKESYLQMDSTSKNNISFYFSNGSRDMKQVRKWTQKLSDNLTGISFSKLDWQYRIFEGKDHYNSDVISLINGMRGLK
jgi:predicted alpha/beta superfamily hydrolase